MDNAQDDKLGKLLPKAIAEKRRQRKQNRTAATGSLRTSKTSSSFGGDSDGTGSASASNLADEDDERSLRDDRSFGSFESGLEPENATATGRAPFKSSNNSRNPSRAQSQSPTRPGAVSQHPSLIGYLTTASPVVQAAHIDPQSQPASPQQQAVRPSSIDSGLGPQLPTTATAAETPADLPKLKLAFPGGSSRSGRDIDQDVAPPLTPTYLNRSREAPSIVNTPPSPVQPLPETDSLEKRAATWKLPNFSPAAGSPTGRTSNQHKRSSSTSATIGPSKLSSSVTALTPPPEGLEATLGQPNSGFFSSMISAAQSAANNLSSNIQNSGLALGTTNKGKSPPTKPRDQESSPADNTETESSQPPTQAQAPAQAQAQQNNLMDQKDKDSAVRTLGAGGLSLDHFGIEEPVSSTASHSVNRFMDIDSTRARSESAPADSQNGIEFLPEEAASRPRSLNEGQEGETTPPQSQLDLDDKMGMSRAGSLRRAHRKRGSSVTTAHTGTNMGAPLGNLVSPVSQPTANLSTPKLTGFAIASKKRNRDFHSIFKSVPDDDYLIEDYSCALQREILAHGRLYVSEGHLCFSSNILGWTTTLVISFDEIVSVEKRSTALVFKNGLMISTLHAKHVFASFTSRDATYDLIINIWKLGHPTLTSTLNGVRLEGTGGDKTEKLDGTQSIAGTETVACSDDSDEESDDDGDEFYDEGDSEDGVDGDNGMPVAEGEVEKIANRKASGVTASNGVSTSANKDGPVPNGAVEFPGPATHAPTDCGDAASHYDRVVGDDVIAAPLGRIYDLMFGQHSAAFMTKFLAVDQKCLDVQMEDKRGMGPDNKTRTYNYIKPLNGPIGPKQTKCIISESLDSLDFEKSANVTIQTQTPDVPNGNMFVIKTKYCLSWAENNSTRVFVNCGIEWSGKSWIKGPIEKGANEGQIDHCRAIFASLRAAISTRPRAGTGPGAGANGAKIKRKGKKGKQSQPSDAEKTPTKTIAKPDWGLLEPIRPLLEPVTDLFKPLLGGNLVYGLILGLLMASWLGLGLNPRKGASKYGALSGAYAPDRIAAYEEIWQREDSELWDWLEERTGLHRLNSDGPSTRKKAMSPRTAEEKLRAERSNTRNVEEAIRVTEEKLKVMQEAMEKFGRAREGQGSPSAGTGV
ncbi:GRAM domain-containing protein [Emericellopsis atlantica]|uniref:GRAM domain-containing protein n=1 Tax=Emericellopsis atlantica TaxID=2614577 RepID=A0A9P7ZKK8_9HYPO|nr:GRAM domain-containing protein [Emericellopsis atlantica]KAG9253397.1 GRAM domain-containing protein [Emericellopsis atlantica]